MVIHILRGICVFCDIYMSTYIKAIEGKSSENIAIFIQQSYLYFIFLFLYMI